MCGHDCDNLVFLFFPSTRRILGNIATEFLWIAYIGLKYFQKTSWLHRASNNVETFLLPTDAHNVKKHRVIKTF